MPTRKCYRTIFRSRGLLEINDTPPNQSVWMKDAKILKSAEPHLDVTPKEGQDTLDGTEHLQPKRICDICSPKCFDHFSWDALQMEKHIVEELGPLSSPVIVSSKLKLPKAEDARKEGTPVSPMDGSFLEASHWIETFSCNYSHRVEGCQEEEYQDCHIRTTFQCDSRGRRHNPWWFQEVEAKEPHLDVTLEEGQKALDGKEKKKAKGCFGSLLKMFHIHSSENLSGDTNQRERHKVKEHIEDVLPMSSLMNGSTNDNMAKPEEIRIISVPVSPIVSQEKFPKVKPTTTMKDSFPNEAVGIKAVRTLKPEPSLKVKTEERKMCLMTLKISSHRTRKKQI
ncbi:uncharacterized protein [Marmota flaviventris]|uniref:uncharacterized protein isoform X3 n=1 Tax=Marmota flaviventris TaxID=93162 RepID=UPI003A85EED9